MERWYGGIEAGGTKFVCGVGTGPDNLHEVRFDTTTPDETLSRAVAFFRKWHSRKPLSAIGIGSFGPICLDRRSVAYGSITSTPKPGWANAQIVQAFQKAFLIRVGFDTDVNAAALGEGEWGAARGLDHFIYLTVGTGIGGGAMVNGKLLHGLVHPEMGHTFIPRRQDDVYPGRCAFHGNRCFEGLASGPAIEERWGKPAIDLGAGHPAWELESEYIAVALADIVFTLSPLRIILGGGVMKQSQLFPLIRRKMVGLLNGYIQSDTIIKNIDEYIVPPALGDRSGVLGAIALARMEHATARPRRQGKPILKGRRKLPSR